MESAGLRNRTRAGENEQPSSLGPHSEGEDKSVQPPKYTIDLSLPPRERYQQIAKDFAEEVKDLPVLFDELVRDLHPKLSLKTVHWVARKCLRRVHSQEETEELRGISEVLSIPMYLLVAFNVLLDLLMGCTSGGVRVKNKDGISKMIHFRTLDWGMPPLRKVVVQLDFVDKAGGPVLATSITYAGYVGLLTGIRKGLSTSLNFRPNHDSSTKVANFRFYFHHLLVLLGFRPSISSTLRRYMIPSEKSINVAHTSGRTLDSIQRNLPGVPSTACYLIFCDGMRTLSMEKDHKTALIQSANDFIVATNHDAIEETSPKKGKVEHASSKTLQITGMEDLVEESLDRRACAVKLWKKATKESSKGSPESSKGDLNAVTEAEVIGWMKKYPIANEETHFAAVLDPNTGSIAWVQRYLEPLG